jgi:hypothetical protein
VQFALRIFGGLAVANSSRTTKYVIWMVASPTSGAKEVKVEAPICLKISDFSH